MSKSGLVFLMDRVTGKSICGVEERPVRRSEVRLDRRAKTRRFPVKRPRLSRMTRTAADIATVTPQLEAVCKKLIEGVQLGGPSLPVGYNRLRLQLPGNHGGVNWGGASFNPTLGYLFVNSSEYGQLHGHADRPTTVAPSAAAPPAAGRGDPELAQQQAPPAGRGRGGRGGGGGGGGAGAYGRGAGGGRLQGPGSKMEVAPPPRGNPTGACRET